MPRSSQWVAYDFIQVLLRRGHFQKHMMRIKKTSIIDTSVLCSNGEADNPEHFVVNYRALYSMEGGSVRIDQKHDAEKNRALHNDEC